MNYTYGHEQLIKAISILIRGKGRIKERLSEAYNESLKHIGVVPNKADLPNQFMLRWQEIKAQLTKGGFKNNLGDLENTLDHLTEDEASYLAANIETLQTEVDSWLDANPSY